MEQTLSTADAATTTALFKQQLEIWVESKGKSLDRIARSSLHQISAGLTFQASASGPTSSSVSTPMMIDDTSTISNHVCTSRGEAVLTLEHYSETRSPPRTVLFKYSVEAVSLQDTGIEEDIPPGSRIYFTALLDGESIIEVDCVRECGDSGALRENRCQVDNVLLTALRNQVAPHLEHSDFIELLGTVPPAVLGLSADIRRCVLEIELERMLDEATDSDGSDGEDEKEQNVSVSGEMAQCEEVAKDSAEIKKKKTKRGGKKRKTGAAAEFK